MRNRRRHLTGLNHFAPYVLALLLGLLIDLASNLVCDWWSSSCVDLSALLFRAYGYGSLLLAALGSRFAWEHGMFNATHATISLGEEISRLSKRAWMEYGRPFLVPPAEEEKKHN